MNLHMVITKHAKLWWNPNRIGSIMINVLALSVVDCGFEPRLGQTTDYKIGICSFSAKYAALRSNSKDWLPRNQNNVSGWSDMSTRWLLFQWASTIEIQLSVLVLEQSRHHHHFIENNLFSPWYSWKIAYLELNNNHSLTWWNPSSNVGRVAHTNFLIKSKRAITPTKMVQSSCHNNMRIFIRQ